MQLGLWDVLIIAAAAAVLAGLWWADVVRPGSFRRRGVRRVRAAPGLVWLAAAVTMLLAPIIGQTLAAAVVTATGWGGPGVQQQLADGNPPLEVEVVLMLATYAVGIGAAAALIWTIKRASNTVRIEGLRVRATDVPIGALCLALAAPVYILTSTLIEIAAGLIMGHPPEQIAHQTLLEIVNDRSNPWDWGLIAIVVVGAPIVEEVTFRVFFQGALLRWIGGGDGRNGAWWAILITSVLFALVHVGSTPWYGMASLFFFGMMLGVAYERTRRLGVSITMHALFNALMIAQVMLSPPPS